MPKQAAIQGELSTRVAITQGPPLQAMPGNKPTNIESTIKQPIHKAPNPAESVTRDATTNVHTQVLKLLTQSILKLPDINANLLKQWFNHSRLIDDAKATESPVAAINPYKILKQLGGKESLLKELFQAAEQNPKTAANEQASVRNQAAESSPLSLNEGKKLIEQALTQNLLQRTTLGLQQESQQPLSLNLALPYQDSDSVRPLHIELEQRNQPENDDNNSWDIRISFELTGLGSISCHIILESYTVAASFYCEQEITRSKIDQAIPDLKQQLSNAGFQSGEIQSFAGKLARPKWVDPVRVSDSLLDIEV
jgi:hypothetical protein